MEKFTTRKLRIVIKIDYTRDELLDDIAKKTMQEFYMLEGEKSPQDAFARAAKAYADNEAHAQRLYDYSSKLWFMFASPVLANASSDRGLPISCFLNYIHDSRKGLINNWEEDVWLSSGGGGIGTYVGSLRSDGMRTSSGSASTGSIPFMKVLDSLILSIAQGTTRRGALALYQDISHPEIEEFINIRKPTGGDMNRKCLNLHHAVNIPDSFMTIIENCMKDKDANDDWDLIDPHSKKVVKTISAKALWEEILKTRIATGEPFIHFIDTSNNALPQGLKDKGLEIKQSNLCVAPETLILTKTGYARIEYCQGQELEIWNGLEWSKVTIQKTSSKSKLVRITFSDGTSLDCTKYHKFYIQNSYNKNDVTIKETKDLVWGDKLQKWDLPTDVDNSPSITLVGVDPYSQGFYSGDGNKNNDLSWVYAPKYICRSRLKGSFSEQHKSSDRVGWKHGPMLDKTYVPLGVCAKDKVSWLSGLLDADGTIVKSDNGDNIQLASVELGFLNNVRLLLTELGVFSKVRLARIEGDYELPDGRGGVEEYHCKEINRLLIGTAGVKRLLDIGLKTERLIFSEIQDANRSALQFVQVVSVEDSGREDETYCFTEPKRNRGIFNGVCAGNCTEILLPTKSDRTAVCCLSSVNLEYFDEWKDTSMVRDLVRMLDNVLSVFIKKSPEGLARAVKSAKNERSIGLGAMGFHSFLQKKNVPFESPLAKSINKLIFSKIRECAELESAILGDERGSAPDMRGSEDINNWLLQWINGNGIPEELKGKKIKRRNSHLMAIAPNATSSILCGNTSPSIEPFSANAIRQITRAGSYVLKNKFLDKLLRTKEVDIDKVWETIINNNGSVKHLKCLTDDEKEVFKTAQEIDQRWIVEHASDRQKYIDQGQSVNLFVSSDVNVGYLHHLHFLSWKQGLKTLYYLRTDSTRKVEKVNAKVEKFEHKIEDCLACSG